MSISIPKLVKKIAHVFGRSKPPCCPISHRLPKDLIRLDEPAFPYCLRPPGSTLNPSSRAASPSRSSYVTISAPSVDPAQTRAAGKTLHERLTIYPRYVQGLETWVDSELHEALLNATTRNVSCGLSPSSTWPAKTRNWLMPVPAIEPLVSSTTATVIGRSSM